MVQADVNLVVGALERAGHRLTEPRRQLALLIARQSGPFTAADLVAEARRRGPSIGRATVFRALDLLGSLGVVEHLDLPSGEHAYVRCEPAHHHHLVCSRCGRSVEVQDSGVAAAVEEVGRRTGYRIESHRLELFGLCPTCRVASPPATRAAARSGLPRGVP